MNIFRQNERIDNIEVISNIKRVLKEVTGLNVYYEQIERDNKDKNVISFICDIRSINDFQFQLDLEIHIFSNCGSDILELEQITNNLYKFFYKANFNLSNNREMTLRVQSIDRLNIPTNEINETDLRRRDLNIIAILNY